MQHLLFISGCTGKGWAHAKRVCVGVGGVGDAAGHVWLKIERGNLWQSTKLICWGDQSSEQIQRRSGGGVCTVSGNEAPDGNMGRWPTAGLPLDRFLIKVLARSDFIPGWKVSKGPLVMPLILPPCSHIWRHHEGMWQPVDSAEAPFLLFSEACEQSAWLERKTNTRKQLE